MIKAPPNTPVNAPQEVRLFAPGSVPVLGQRSAVDSTALPPGYWHGLQNVRTTDLTLRVRDGAYKLTTAVPVAGASYRGAWTGYLNGTLTVIGAYRVSSETRLYKIVDPTLTSAWTWSEITKSGGTYGNTRFATDGFVAFAPVRDQSTLGAYDLLVCSNGADDPRIYNTDVTSLYKPAATYTVVPHAAITPLPYSQVSATPSPKEYLNVKTAASFGTIANSDATKFYAYSTSATGTATAGGATTLTDGGATWPVDAFKGQLIRITSGTGSGNAPHLISSNTATVITVSSAWTVNPDNTSVYQISDSQGNSVKITGTTSASAQTAEIPFSGTPVSYWSSGVITGKAGLNLGDVTNGITSRQLLMVVQGDMSLPIWNSVQIDLYSATSAAYLTVTPWAPGSNVIAAPLYTDLGNGNYLVAFSLDHLASVVTNMGNITKIKLTWSGSNPTTTQTATILGVMAGGLTQGGASYAVSLMNAPSRSESPGVVATTRIPSCASFGTNLQADFALSTGVYYQYTISFPTASADYALFYRRGTGEIDYYFLGLNGFFSLPGSGGIGNTRIKLDSTGPETEDLSLIAPDAYQQVIPKASCLLSANNRLYVGGISGATSELWVSQDSNPFRFRKTVRYFDVNYPDLTSPTRNLFPGSTVTSIFALPGSFVGVAPVLATTTTDIWRIEGKDSVSLSRPTKVGPHGCPFPRAYTSYQERAWVLDSERQVREVTGGIIGPPITLQKVSDMLRSGNVVGSSMVANSDKLYLTYERTGETTYARSLVYDLTTDEWCEDLLAAGDMAGVLTLDNNSQRVIIAFSDAGHIYQLEKKNQTTDDGSGIVVALTARTLTNGLWTAAQWGRIGVVCDKTSATMTTNRFDPQRSVSVAGTINLNKPTAGWAWAYDTITGGGGDPSISGLACQPSLTATLPGGTHIRGIVIQVMPSDVGPVSG